MELADVNKFYYRVFALQLINLNAVNKRNTLIFLGINNGDIPEKTFILNNNVNTPSNIAVFAK
jgi:hypothetical protein